MEIDNVPMNRIRQNFKPQEGFGGNPIEKESWWRLTDKMKERIERYGIKGEVESAAKAAGLDNFDMRKDHNKIKTKYEKDFEYTVNMIKGSKPKDKEIEIAKLLEEKGYNVLFTPENKFIQGMKNPDGIIRNIDTVIEMKEITSPNKGMINSRITEAVL